MTAPRVLGAVGTPLLLRASCHYCFCLVALLFLCTRVLAEDAVHPAALNVVAVGFHRVESGWVGDYDLERALSGTMVARTISAGSSIHDSLARGLSKFGGGRVPAGAMACLLQEARATLGGLDEGFTLFILNLKLDEPHVYCQETAPLESCSVVMTAGSVSCDSKEECLVNAWISNERLGWIDLSANRTRWGGLRGIDLPMIPTHSYTLEEQQSRSRELKRIALEERDCKDCKSFLVAWSSLLDRASEDPDFSRAYDTVARASDELEGILSRYFATSTESAVVFEASRVAVQHKSAAFIAQLSLVIKSFANRVLLPFNAESVHHASLFGFQEDGFSRKRLNPPAARVTAHIYLVRGHDDVESQGPSEDDLNRMREELKRLEAPKLQEFLMVIHHLDLDEDPILATAFAFATQSMFVPDPNHNKVHIRNYVDSKVFRDILSSSSNDRSSSYRASGLSSLSSSANEYHIELPVFWFFGVDSPETPLYVDVYHRAVNLEELVLVVESRHADVERPNAVCGSKNVKVSVQRPLRAAILATVHSWWISNLGGAAAYVDGDELNWTWSTGVGDATGNSIFAERWIDSQSLLSTVVVDAFHRSTVLESFRRINSILVGLEKDESLAKELSSIQELRLDVSKCARRADWECAFANLGQALRQAAVLSQSQPSSGAGRFKKGQKEGCISWKKHKGGRKSEFSRSLSSNRKVLGWSAW